MSHHYFEIYPPSDENALYFVEFKQFSQDEPITWQLFRRNYFEEKGFDWCNNPGPLKELEKHPLCSNECHPWNLGEGELVDDKYPNAVSMDTKSFLKFMVDSLNKNVRMERQ